MITNLLFSLVVSKMDDNYIEFELNNKKLKINREDSNDILIWKDRCGERMYKFPYWFKPKLETVADGYFRIFINGKKYYLQRVVYFAHNQDWDILDNSCNNLIDHKYPNKQNNHISNLRVGDASLNAQNKKNVKGYYWNKRSNNYQASIIINWKYIYLGKYKKEEDARNAYLDAKKKYHKWNI